ncbi:histone-lysine N-methyltransferase ash1 isoform X2 [Cylas formicarius]|uniref:histone-lysine N-methyltransferase ash1 isoform X2 n=1 Tax=Cylas formicarius TaxID=197179 RepID=UPI002958D1F1|nr:histone-lysine N-methyltransferase ash1 isoform X2 [Cylas formicarius]
MVRHVSDLHHQDLVESDAGAIAEGVWQYVSDLLNDYKSHWCSGPDHRRDDEGYEDGSSSNQMASLPHSRSSTYSSSDSETSDDLLPASCSLQEIRQEDLAAILPDQNDCNDFNDFECKNAKDSPATGDMSGSDMELPQQAIKSLIERTTESSSDGEGHQLPNPQTLFANRILQQFVAETQVVANPCQSTAGNSEGAKCQGVAPSTVSAKESICDNSQGSKAEAGSDHPKRKRGRPKKGAKEAESKVAEVRSQDFCTNPNVSPDSGIQNSPDHVSSPEPSLSPHIRQKATQNKDEKRRKPSAENKASDRSRTLKHQKQQDKTKMGKLSVTSNQFDRVLYANADKVLYPPRRKVGRPPMRKGPGRPPKNKTESAEAKGATDKTVQNSKNAKSRNKTACAKNGKQQEASKTNNKPCTLKIPKIFHSKHKQKHKKRKFKILKPLMACDPKINQEIEKLVTDFVKFCVIATKQPKENVPEQILKTLKKVTKKRRTTEHVEKKKKKQSVNTTVNKVNNSNEQRLPLKKRHYHLVSNSSETGKADAEETKDKAPEREEEMKRKEKVNKSAPVTPKHVSVIKNHTNNNEYELKTETKEANVHIDEAIEACITKFSDEKTAITEEKVMTTTPKKRHRLENMSCGPETQAVVKTETVASSEEKVKPKITVESFIHELKIKRNLTKTIAPLSETEEDEVKKDDVAETEQGREVPEVEKKIEASPESTKKKVRKRRAFNRTGFPSVKKKKKRSATAEAASPEEAVTACDRVPKEGEEYTKFMERSSEKKAAAIEAGKAVMPGDDLMSECESLPQEERTDFEAGGGDKDGDGDDDHEMSLLESSIERLKSRLDRKKRKRGRECKGVVNGENGAAKKRKRDVSPASSVPSNESRMRDDRASVSGDETKKNKKVPRWRKRFLVAGLFSDYYKEDESKRQENTKSLRNLIYNPEDHPYGLLPPPYHCGKYLRCRRVDFQLPYDLWWQHTHSQLPGRDVVPSWNYRKIRTNVYNVKTSGGTCEPQACNCKPSSNCGDDCINRLVYSECPATHRCHNQKIQKHEWAPGIEKFMTEDKGWGVRTKEPIKQSEFILEYVGEVVSDQEFKERMNSIYVNDTHHYCLHLDGGLVIDGHRMGGDGRFVNHSCQPNCEMQKWSVNGQFRMALFALRDIEPYEELTYDYNFSLFNPAEGQECKCGSDNCRGVIGGKTQRIRQLPESGAPPKNPGRVGRPRKTEATKKKPCAAKEVPAASVAASSLGNGGNPPPAQVVPQIQVKPMSHQQKVFILEHHCFLLRNLTKVRKVRDRSLSTTSNTASRQQTATPTDTSAFMNQLNALQKPRNMKTRRIAQAEDDPELKKTVKLAAVLKEICHVLINAKDDDGEPLCAGLMQLPSKRKVPEFYQRVSNPIDIATIEQNIATGVYKSPQAFDEDITRLFVSFSKFYGRTSDTGICATKLKKIYADTKQRSLAKLEDVLGAKPPPTFVNNRKKHEEEDIIRCICGIPRDEGLMIQCERCMVWQHNECVKADVSAASYHCEICVPRPVEYEIPMDEFTEHGHRYYMTLMRGTLQLRQGDTVYVLRDIPITGTDQKHTYETIGKIDYTELDIFRIERLWKDKDSGKRFAYGHHYLRPHETFHEPTRKFFPNEVMRVPLYEAVPVELVMEHCWVMDVNTFCKGRPIGAQEQHIYICEYRVDKAAKMFSKASKSKFPICTKSFAFECFETRLKISRTYCPHEVDESLIKGSGGRKKENKEEKAISKYETNNVQTQPVPAVNVVTRTPAQRKTRLNKILLNLLSKMPTKHVLDVSYLLEGGRRRKKQEGHNKQ